MPKIISKGTTVASGDETHYTDQSVHTYQCLCGSPCLNLDAQLEKLPRRNTDGSYVVRGDQHQYKLTAKKLPRVTLQRARGFERQYRYACVDCSLPICYFPQEEGSPVVYVMDGALRLRQGAATPTPSTSSAASSSTASSSTASSDTQAQSAGETVDNSDTAASSSSASSIRPILSLKEQERQIKEKLRVLEKGEDLPYMSPPASQLTSNETEAEGKEKQKDERDEGSKSPNSQKRVREDDGGEDEKGEVRESREPDEKRTRTDGAEGGVQYRDRERGDRERERDRDRGRDRDRDRDRRSRERERSRERDRASDRDRDRHRGRDSDRDRDRRDRRD